MSVVRFDRTGELVAMGGDIKGRPDCVEFFARAGERTIDWLAEVTVTISAWMTRAGIGTIFERQHDEEWAPVASAMPFDAIYVRGLTAARLVFSSYVRLQPGGRYRVFMPGAVVESPTIQVTALARDPEPPSARKGWSTARRRSA